MHKQDLIKFEEEIKNLFIDKKIRAPIHLSGGNEDALINLFKNIKLTDWIFSTWRNHYHWLLSGRSLEELKQKIIDGNSMHVFSDRFFTSAIVGGIAPIAVGTAMAIKRQELKDHVWCFLGDMGASTGIAMESIKYSSGHDLPITFIIENNRLSVKAKTEEVWGENESKKTIEYFYEREYPHAGCGVFVFILKGDYG